MNPVNKELLNELRNIWQNTEKDPFAAVVKVLKEKFINSNSPQATWERCLIYGTLPIQDRIVEEYVGTFIAFAPEIMIVDCRLGSMPELTGLLIHSVFRPSLFQLVSFDLNQNILCIELSNPENNKKLKLPENYPALFHFQFGGGMSGSDEIFGIEPSRWLILNEWLNKWLPETK